MSTERNKELVRRLFGAADRAAAAESIRPLADALLAADLRVHAAGAPGPLDRAGFLEMARGFAVGFPGHRHTVEDAVAGAGVLGRQLLGAPTSRT